MFATAAFIGGTIFVCVALWLRSRSRACRHWPSVPGQVLESRVDDAHLEMVKPVLRYRYEVAGTAYVGFRIAFSGYGTSRRALDDLIKPYPVGRSVRVYYDPQDPASAVLNNTSHSDWVFWLLVGVATWLVGVYLVQ